MKRRFSGESVEQPGQEANDVLSGGSSGGLSINNLGDQLGLDDPLKAEVIEFVRQEMPAGISWGFFCFNPVYIDANENSLYDCGKVGGNDGFSESSPAPRADARFYARAAVLQDLFRVESVDDIRKGSGFEFLNDREVIRLEDLNQIFSMVFYVLSPPLSARSVIEYKRALKRMALSGLDPLEYAVKFGISRGTLRKYRAAHVRKVVEEILILINWRIEEKTNDYDEEIYAKTTEICYFWNKSFWGAPAELKNCSGSQKNSKRKTLKGLPWNWREQFLGFTRSDLDRVLAAVIICTGCRPSEACGGVLVSRSEYSDEIFEFYIIGSKTSLATQGGQPLRKLVVDLSNSPIVMGVISKWVDMHGGYAVTDSINVKNFSARMSRVGKRCGFSGVTAYSIRHQMSADLKKLGFSPELVSAAMGHASGKSKSYYGRAGQARLKSGSNVLSVECSREVINSHSDWLDRVRSGQPGSTNNEAVQIEVASDYESDSYRFDDMNEPGI